MKNKLFSSLFLVIPLLVFTNDPPSDATKVASSSMEIYLYTTDAGIVLDGETQNAHFVNEKALAIQNLEFSTSNNVYFGTGSGGLSSGKASGNAMTFTTPHSKAIVELYKKLCDGGHFEDIIIPIGFSTGGSGPNAFDYREKIELKFVLVSSIKVIPLDPATGEVDYEVTIEYGAIKRTMYEVDQFNVSTNAEVVWSYVLNSSIFSVTP